MVKKTVHLEIPRFDSSDLLIAQLVERQISIHEVEGIESNSEVEFFCIYIKYLESAHLQIIITGMQICISCNTEETCRLMLLNLLMYNSSSSINH